ncbi:MAG: DUF1573 domain-containing protein [Bacteroidetes bacterium]|nr:DUF1573 domain-containing protein [Bacteroidota bacterium]
MLAMAVCALTATYSNAQQATPVADAKQETPRAENKNAPEFKFDVAEYNFGEIKSGESVTYEYVFTNAGKEPLTITSANGSCGCTVPIWPKEPIKKGEKGTIKVTFNSTGKQGMQDKTITIQSNAKTNPMVLHIKGNVIKAAETPVATPAVQPGHEGHGHN